MIKTALQLLLDQANLTKRETRVDACDRAFLLNPQAGTYGEITPRESPNRTHAFGTVAALTAYLSRWGEKEGATVLVTPTGIKAEMDERQHYRRDVVTVPFFAADFPPDRALDHEALLLYLDRHTGKIEGEPELRAVLGFVKAKEGVKLSSRDMGASTRVELKATKQVEARNAEDQVVTIPNYLTLTLRLGTREYEEPHRFRLLVTADDGAVSFRLLHLDRAGALDRFLTRCVADVRTALGEGWHVYEGA